MKQKKAKRRPKSIDLPPIVKERNIVGTYKVSQLFHVAPITVGRWLAAGKIPFFPTPGGHRRMYLEDVIKFMQKNGYPAEMIPDILTKFYRRKRGRVV